MPCAHCSLRSTSSCFFTAHTYNIIILIIYSISMVHITHVRSTSDISYSIELIILYLTLSGLVIKEFIFTQKSSVHKSIKIIIHKSPDRSLPIISDRVATVFQQ